MQAEGDRPHARIGGRRGQHGRARRIVRVHHRGAIGLAASRQQGEEPGLGVAVGLERAVEVEVVLGQVGEDGHVELDPVHAGERQGVRGDLHRGAADADAHHARQQRLQLEGLGRGLAGRLGLVADAILDRADDAGGPPARAQQGLHEQRRGGLAVRAGDGDHGEPPRGMAVVGIRQPREGLARRRHDDAWRRAARQRVGALRDDHGRAPPDRVGGEAPTVLLEAGDGHEELARRDFTRIVRDTRHAAGQGAQYRLVRQRLEQRGGGHGGVAHVLTAGGSRPAWHGRRGPRARPGARAGAGTSRPRRAGRRAAASGRSRRRGP